MQVAALDRVQLQEPQPSKNGMCGPKQLLSQAFERIANRSLL